MAQRIRLPANGWMPRPDQMPLWSYLENGGRRAIIVAHRRWGKDDVCLHHTAAAAHLRVGTYWHMLPEATQARKVIWEAVNPHTSKRRIDEAFPPELRDTTQNNEMFIRFKCGSTWQVVGSDNFNSLVGSPPIGVVFSEFALADPQAWAFLRPILLENGGWAVFPYTPRGRNHGATFYENHKGDPDWFVQKLTAHDTPVFTGAQLDQELREYIREFGQVDGTSRFNQEYLCDFEAAVVGAYYGTEMADAERDGRISGVPWDPAHGVQTWWDLGYDDSTTIWFVQHVGREVRCIDYIEANGEDIPHYVKALDAKPYRYSEHILPHDAGSKTLASAGKSIQQIMQALGLRGTKVVPVTQDILGDIAATRMLIPRCWFDRVKCARGIEALRMYRKEWDDKNKVFKSHPLHDWSSHGADGFRTGAIGGSVPRLERPETRRERNRAGAWLG